jgi:16S rRNA (cytosine967-C5)-methyltransferase
LSDALLRARDALSSWDPRSARDALRGADRLSGSQTGSYVAWVNGVLRRRRTLGVVLGAVARRALKKRSPDVVAALELCAFRLLFQGVDPARVRAQLGSFEASKKAREHIAHVLAALEGSLTERVTGSFDAEDDARDDLLPVSRTEAVRFNKPLLGIEARKPAGRLGILHSLPDALVESWLHTWGAEKTLAVCWSANDAPPLFARVQSLRTDVESLSAALKAEGVEATPRAEVAGALLLGEGRGRFRHTQSWRDGKFSIQDLTAQRAALLLAPQAGERILDLCAAPGGKTTGIAELASDQAYVLACDVKPRRLRKVEENARRLGLTSIRTRSANGKRPDAVDGEAPFDAVLVDAPCSNTGVLRRKSEARWRYDRRSQQRIARTQEAILTTALTFVAPGGRLVYSVCSVEAEEGEALVAAVVERDPAWRLESQALHLPERDGGDGGYLALLRRS